jgi:hypothetical protein
MSARRWLRVVFTFRLGVFEERGFADAVCSIWLGPKPPSEDLKKGMLG